MGADFEGPRINNQPVGEEVYCLFSIK